jgi:hypothetical protein
LRTCLDRSAIARHFVQRLLDKLTCVLHECCARR